MSNYTQKIIRTQDSPTLAIYDWPHNGVGKARGAVLIVHSITEYALMHKRLVQQLQFMGFAVRSFDWHGHGESGSLTDGIRNEEHLGRDVAAVMADWRLSLPAQTPMLVWAYSMGALPTGQALLDKAIAPDAVILVSPNLRLYLNPIGKIFVKLIKKLSPEKLSPSQFDAKDMTRNPEAALLYHNDPKVKTTITMRMVHYILRIGSSIVARAHEWDVPTLVLYAGIDKVADKRGTIEFLAHAPKQVQGYCFEESYHQLFDEPERDEYYRRMEQWIDVRFPKMGR